MFIIFIIKKANTKDHANDVSEENSFAENIIKEWTHDSLDWLKEDKVK